MRRTVRLVIALCALAAFAAPAAMAAERMWVGFHDDPSFRWVPDRASRIQGCVARGRDDHAAARAVEPGRADAALEAPEPVRPGIQVRRHRRGAPHRRRRRTWRSCSRSPARPAGRTAAGTRTSSRGSMADFTAFARAIATRYSGRFNGFPFVRFYSVWNEPNLNLFLTPQFNSAGKSVAPANYAKLYAAAYAGIKAGNSMAKIGIGETSARGRDRRVPGVSDTHSPGKFAELVAKANPRLKFDAWSHHPYPFNPNSQAVPGREVAERLARLASPLQRELKKWFNRKSAPIWVTEYGHQTRPEDTFGVPYSTQAAYIQQSMAIAKRFPFVGMFIWFVYQDDQGQPWESGLYRAGGAPKGSSPASSAPARGRSTRETASTASARAPRRRSSTCTPAATASTTRRASRSG